MGLLVRARAETAEARLLDTERQLGAVIAHSNETEKAAEGAYGGGLLRACVRGWCGCERVCVCVGACGRKGVVVCTFVFVFCAMCWQL